MIAVIGCGNANRSDDAAGLEVVRLLYASERLKSRSDVHLLDAGTDGMAVMFAARGCSTLIVVDSCRTGAEPATLFEVPGQELESRHAPSLNLHDFRWDHALFAGRQIYRDSFPTDVTAYLIEARSLELGCELSPDIRAAAQTVANRIEARIAAIPLAAPPLAGAL
jgi:hydrogenase maturation protease